MDADGVAMGPRHICMHPSGRYAYVNNEIGSAVTPIKIDAETGGMSIAGPSLSSTPDDWTAASVAAKTTCMFTDRPALISHCAPRHSRTLNPHTTTPSPHHHYHHHQSHARACAATLPLAGADSAGGLAAGAHIAIHPTGRWVYCSNRGHDSIAVYAVNEADGTLSRSVRSPLPSTALPNGRILSCLKCVRVRPFAQEITLTGGETPRNFQINAAGTLLLAGNQDSDTIYAFSIDQATGTLTPTGAVGAAPSPVSLCIV